MQITLFENKGRICLGLPKKAKPEQISLLKNRMKPDSTYISNGDFVVLVFNQNNGEPIPPNAFR